MELKTALPHIKGEEDFSSVLKEHSQVMICCGRMGPMCVPVFGIMENLRDAYPGVAFYDMHFDHPAAHVIKDLPICRGFMGLPYTVYFKDGEPVKATSSIQTREEVEAILKEQFSS